MGSLHLERKENIRIWHHRTQPDKTAGMGGGGCDEHLIPPSFAILYKQEAIVFFLFQSVKGMK
jgi:hypothetical protein